MTKITLTNLVNLQNETTAVNAINSNNATITAAFDNTLSRDGTSPNQMGAALDMNSNRIVNLPTPISLAEPITLAQANTLNGGGIITVNNLPTGGTTHQILDKNSSADFDTAWVNNTPVLTGDVTASFGSSATTIAANAVTNAKAAQMATFTLKGNATGSTANAQDISIAGLTAKATPTTSDILLITDAAASNALKKATLGTSAVTSIAGNRGDFTLGGGLTNSTNIIKLSNTGAAANLNVGDPAATSATGVGVMMGVGSSFTITPNFSTRVVAHIQGIVNNTTTGINTTVTFRFGTGTAPVNGAAATGSVINSGLAIIAAPAAYQIPFNHGGILTGLTPGVTYWFDLSVSVSANTGAVKSLSFYAFEM